MTKSSAAWQAPPHLEDLRPVEHRLAVTIRQPTKPVQVNLEPGGRALPFDDRDGTIHLTLPRLEIHDIIVL